MDLGWREAKNRKNKLKHRISFEYAQAVFDDPNSWMEKNQFVRGEQRYATTGMIGTELLTVIHTYVQENDQESADIISARKATPTERHRYQLQKS